MAKRSAPVCQGYSPGIGATNRRLTKSNPARALEGLHAARAALMAGFTTLRDLDNEGADLAEGWHPRGRSPSGGW